MRGVAQFRPDRSRGPALSLIQRTKKMSERALIQAKMPRTT
jgi:hypothetical protein